MRSGQYKKRAQQIILEMKTEVHTYYGELCTKLEMIDKVNFPHNLGAMNSVFQDHNENINRVAYVYRNAFDDQTEYSESLEESLNEMTLALATQRKNAMEALHQEYVRICNAYSPSKVEAVDNEITTIKSEVLEEQERTVFSTLNAEVKRPNEYDYEDEELPEEYQQKNKVKGYTSLSTIDRLQFHIKMLDKNENHEPYVVTNVYNENRKKFVDALKELHAHIKVEHGKYVSQGKSNEFLNTPEQAILENTVNFLENIHNPDHKKDCATLLKKYDKACYNRTNKLSTLGKLVGTVVITGICAIVGLGIGLGVDAVFGFASLGAFGVGGLLKGAGIGTVVSTALFGVVGIGSSTFGLFRNSAVEIGYKQVTKEAKGSLIELNRSNGIKS